MTIIESILIELGPFATIEILDYLRSDFFCQKSYYNRDEWTRSKVRYQLNKISKNNKKIFKFHSSYGYLVRYGYTKFIYYLLEEPRYLKVQGYLKHCMYCGMPIYINDKKVFHFKYKCKQYQPQEYFKLLKINNFWAIISNNFVYGILDDLHSCKLRLPENNQNKANDNIFSELWLINEVARENEIIESDCILQLKAEECII
ncbi:MAG: hypothetical protein JXA99_08420 [Candidatus Lokiarchaeota archaeon]|nr:hypothetical protein [Candidatus Lokiarchaeota archaeon]